MKNLIDFIEDCTTPGNTLGMGNPCTPTEDSPGSEPLTAKCKKERNKKRRSN